MSTAHDIVWIGADGQRLGLVPTLGGGVAEWSVQHQGRQLHLWRPWDGQGDDAARLASYALLPWSNRISGGGFEHGGRHWPVRRNRPNEAYPIHGEGWQLPWTLHDLRPHAAELRLSARHHDGSPYAYDAVQRFELSDGGLVQTLGITHRGAGTLPYGLGLHPWIMRTPLGTLQARVDGVWLSGDDRISTSHSNELAPDWDLNTGIGQHGSFIDNAYTGWDGLATITWPEHGLALQMTLASLTTPSGPVAPAYCLVYRPGAGAAFCFEPVTHPIDAFHLPGRPGLVELGTDQTLACKVRWRIDSASRT